MTTDNFDYSSMSTMQYLSHFHVDFLVNDLFKVFQRKKVSNEFLNSLSNNNLNDEHHHNEENRVVCQFGANNFVETLNGLHILGRDFEFVNSSPWNRRCFVRHLNQVTSTLKDSATTSNDFHDLLCVICNDFPFTFIKDAARFAEQIEKTTSNVYLNMAEMCKPENGRKDLSSRVSVAAQSAELFLGNEMDMKSKENNEKQEQNELESNTNEKDSKPTITQYKFQSLQQMFTCFFVYAEFLQHVRTVFDHFDGVVGGDDGDERLMDRGLLLDEMSRKAAKHYSSMFPSAELMEEIFLRGDEEEEVEKKDEEILEEPSDDQIASGPPPQEALISFQKVIHRICEVCAFEAAFLPYKLDFDFTVPHLQPRLTNDKSARKKRRSARGRNN